MFSRGIERKPMIGREGESLTMKILDSGGFNYQVDLKDYGLNELLISRLYTQRRAYF